jgi:hypothetical protein
MTTKAERAEREKYAKLVDAMISEVPWCQHMWSRAALMIAARAIRRGRHFTPEEKIQNLMRAVFGKKKR